MASGHVGRIFQLNVSNGGVPKYAVDAVHVGFEGLSGDRQADRRAHGGPERAVCLYSLEHIDDLAADGHNVFPGAMGENVTLEGLAWPAIRPGDQLRLGAEVVLRVTGYAEPCWKNAGWFQDGDITRIDQDRFPGWSRVYAKVVSVGRLATGDSVEVLPGAVADRIRTHPVMRWPQDFQ